MYNTIISIVSDDALAATTRWSHVHVNSAVVCLRQQRGEWTDANDTIIAPVLAAARA